MNTAFSQATYVIKQQGLSIGGKYRLYGQGSDKPLLFIEEVFKWLPPSTSTHVYADEQKKQELLTFKESKSEDVDVDVIDAETGQKIGGIGMAADSASEIIKDAWHILDADDQPIAQVFEPSLGQSVLRGMLDNQLPQQLDIAVGDNVVGQLRQKTKMVGYELAADFSMDVVHCLDRRLGVAAAIFVALHHGKEP